MIIAQAMKILKMNPVKGFDVNGSIL